MKKIVLLFVFLHCAFWAFNYWRECLDHQPFLHSLLYQALMSIGFYINYFVIVPRLFKRNKAWSYFLWAFILFGSSFIVKSLMYFFLVPTPNQIDLLFGLGYSVCVCFYTGSVSTALRLGYDWAVNEEHSKGLQLMSTNAKIQFMKSNINLPFIVESLSHMESLAQKDPSSVIDPLLQLSNILRYSTYDATAESIELGKEVDVMEEYVALVNQMELEYSLKISIDNLKEATLTVPNLMIKIVSFWRQQLSPYMTGEHLIHISSTENGSQLMLPKDLRFDMAHMLLHYPEISSVFFRTHYFYTPQHLILEINALKP